MKPRKTESMDRLPPHDIAAEQSVLGACLLDPAQALPVCIGRIGGKVETFYDVRHQLIYACLVDMFEAQEAIDLVMLNNWLEIRGEKAQVGGVPYLAHLPECCPSAANVAYHLDILFEHFRARQLIRISTEAVAAVYDHTSPAEEVIGRVSQEMMDLNQTGVPLNEETPVHELIIECINRIELIHQNQGAVTGLASGFPDLDKMTTGFQPGELTVIAARPSMGKTALVMNIVDHVALEQGLPVGVFSLEMTAHSLMMRMISARARVNFRHQLTHGDFPRIVTAAGRLRNSGIHINDNAALSILDLRARARRMQQLYGIRLMAVDYLQLVGSTLGRNASRENQVAEVSRGLKAIGKELNIPVIVATQLNRDQTREKDRRPKLSDLRESGAIEQDADLVGMLYRPKWDPNDGDENPLCQPTCLYIAKQRNGPTGDVPLTFMKCYTRFESAAKVTGGDVPQESEHPDLYATHND